MICVINAEDMAIGPINVVPPSTHNKKGGLLNMSIIRTLLHNRIPLKPLHIQTHTGILGIRPLALTKCHNRAAQD